MELEHLKRDRQALEAELTLAGGEFFPRAKKWKCPFHADTQPSASIREGSDGFWRYKCFGCDVSGDIVDIRAKRTGKSVGDILKEINPRQERPTQDKPKDPTAPKAFTTFEDLQGRMRNVVAIYHYGDKRRILRVQEPEKGKRFVQCYKSVDGWVMQAGPKPYPLYKKEELKEKKTVIVVEGEKCVQALEKIRATATTSAGGCNAVDDTDWGPLAGKLVYLWPDKDTPGITYMEKVANILHGLDPKPTIMWLDPAKLPLDEKEDVADLVEEMKDNSIKEVAAQVRALINMSVKHDGVTSLEKRIFDTVSGKRKSLPFPWSWLTKMTQALLPQNVTLMCGDPGVSKSFMLLQCICHWQSLGIPYALYELEDPREFHLHRILAQIVRDGNLTDADWLMEYGDAAKELLEKHRVILDSISENIWVRGTDALGYDAMITWIRERAEEGKRIICVDPITALDHNGKVYTVDKKFCTSMEKLSIDTGTSIVLVTHPKQGIRKGPPNLANLAGGAAWERSAKTVLFLEYRKREDALVIGRNGQERHEEINRRMLILKARNGMGTGKMIGYNFDNGLRLEEVGPIKHKG